MDTDSTNVSGAENDEKDGTMRANGVATPRVNKVLVVISLFLLVCALPVVLQLVRWAWLPQSLAYTYVGLAIVPLGLGFFLRGGFQRWVKDRRTVEPAELEGLYSEIDRYRPSDGQDQFRIEAIKQAESEKTKLESLDRAVFELDALPLRKVLVDLYQPEAELIAKTRAELEYLEEYTSVDDADRVNGIIEDLENITANGANGEDEKRVELGRRLRAELKLLRDKTAWYDRTWATGEWMRTCLTYWVSGTVVVTTLVGILPVIHSQGNWNLCIVHWAALGITGALLSILLQLHNLDVPELGETAGKELLQGTVRRMAIGALTAVLLYAAIWGGALEGPIFPDLATVQAHSQASKVQASATDGETQYDETENQVGENLPKQIVISNAPADGLDKRIGKHSLKNIGLSIFWAIFAGLSPIILPKMSQVVESSLGELRTNGGEE